jgi:hypothetical protein
VTTILRWWCNGCGLELDRGELPCTRCGSTVRQSFPLLRWTWKVMSG